MSSIPLVYNIVRELSKDCIMYIWQNISFKYTSNYYYDNVDNHKNFLYDDDEAKGKKMLANVCKMHEVWDVTDVHENEENGHSDHISLASIQFDESAEANKERNEEEEKDEEDEVCHEKVTKCQLINDVKNFFWELVKIYRREEETFQGPRLKIFHHEEQTSQGEFQISGFVWYHVRVWLLFQTKKTIAYREDYKYHLWHWQDFLIERRNWVPHWDDHLFYII